jgi:hypothetical protein
VASLTALVASLASSAEGTSVGSRAVPRDVTELAAGVALHSLGLAIPGEVVGSTALVASCRAGHTAISTAPKAAESTARDRSSTAHSNAGAGGVGASAL